MGIYSSIKKSYYQNSNNIWTRYMRLIVPAVIGLIVIMDVVIYAVVAKNSQERMTRNCYNIVDHQCKLINEILDGYIADMNIMQRAYHNNPEEFIEYCKDFITGNGREYSYIRLMLPDGKSYTTINGEDPNTSANRKPFKQIFAQGMSLSINNAHPTDLDDSDVFSISIPIIRNGQTVAIICSTFPSTIIDQLLEHESQQNAPGFIALLDDTYLLRVYHDGTKTVSIETLEEKGFEGLSNTIYKGISVIQNEGAKSSTGPYKAPNKLMKLTMICHCMEIGNKKWYITLNMPWLVLNKDILITSGVLIITAILTIIVILLIIKYVTRKVVMDPLKHINNFSNDLGTGRLYSSELKNITSKDELGSLRQNIEKMQQKLMSVMVAISKSTNEVSESAASIKDMVSKISDDAQIQSTCVNEISASVDSMNKHILQNAEMAQKTKTNSEEIGKDIDTINTASDNTLESIQNVINKIKIINEISTRTDLLAINASVEAARAGDNGKGFAVVAAEIRKLAEHCQKASVEINQLSSKSLLTTEHSVQFIQNTILKIRENAENISTISYICNQLLAMTEKISKAVTQLVDITARNSQSSYYMQLSTENLHKNMNILNSNMEFFKLDEKADHRRHELIAEIEKHTSEILKLKTQLVETADSNADTQEADTAFQKAMKSNAADPVADGSTPETLDAAYSVADEGSPEALDAADSITTENNDEFYGNGSASNIASNQHIIKKSHNNLDSEFEVY